MSTLATYLPTRWKASAPISPATGLALARGGALAVILSVLTLFIASIPARFSQLTSTFENLSPSQVLVLRELGLEGTLSPVLLLLVELGVAATFLAIATLIFMRRSDDPVALYVSAALPGYIAWPSPAIDALNETPGLLGGLARIIQAYGFVATILFFYIFPTGHFVPKWTRWIVPSLVAWALAWVVRASAPFDLSNPFRLEMQQFLLLMAWLLTGVVAQLYRHARVATPLERRQTKLILFGACIGVAGYLLFGFDRFAVATLREAHIASFVYDLVGVPLFLLTVLAVPLCFAASILRYRLWEIEELLGRAFLYTLLTALLGGMYTASITLSQRVFVALTGEKSDAAIVVTTLLVASSFTPLKNALQGLADSRIKYKPDPTRSLNMLVDRLQLLVEAIDANELTGRGLEEAMRAFGAGSGAVYLQRDGRYVLAHASGSWDQVEGMSAWLDWNSTRYGWIALGPRGAGGEYSAAERRTFEELVRLIARAMWLLDRSPQSAGNT